MNREARAVRQRGRASGSEAGLSIIECVAAIALLVVGASVTASSLASYAKGVRHSEIQGEVYDLRRYVEAHVDCGRTMATHAGGCDGTAYVALLEESCKELSPATAAGKELFGRYAVRAKCGADAQGSYLDVEFALKATTGKTAFAKNPLTGKQMAWADLFKEPMRCSRQPYVIGLGYFSARYLDKVYGPGLTSPGRDASLRMSSVDFLCKSMGFAGVKYPLPGGNRYDSPGNNDVIAWDAAQQKWKKSSAGATGNASHFGWSKAYCIDAQATATACPATGP